MTWPVLAGPVPPLDSWFVPRPETGLETAGAPRPGETVVLTDSDREPAAGHAALGGTGKTQLAAAYARSAWAAHDLDLLVWVTASSRDGIVTGYADALAAVGAAGPREDGEAAARRFLSWLADSGRPWLVVLDGLAEPADADGLWPEGPAGRVIATTRRAPARRARVVRTSGSRRSTWPRSWDGCRWGWPTRPRRCRNSGPAAANSGPC